MKKVQVECSECGKTIWRTQGQLSGTKKSFCSAACNGASNGRLSHKRAIVHDDISKAHPRSSVRLECENCGKEFVRRFCHIPKHHHFCSLACDNDWRRTKMPESPLIGSLWESKGYIHIYLMKRNIGGNGYYPYHRWIIEQELGRKLGRREIVHHKNGNKLDNRRENLELMSLSDHMSYHAKRRLGGLPCLNGCGKYRRKNSKGILHEVCQTCKLAAKLRYHEGSVTVKMVREAGLTVDRAQKLKPSWQKTRAKQA